MPVTKPITTAKELVEYLFTNNADQEADICARARPHVLYKLEEFEAAIRAEVKWTKDVPTEQGWYWHCWDGGDVPFPLSVLKHSAGKLECFVSIGQAGITRAIDCDEYGGWWASLSLPSVPDKNLVSPKPTPPGSTVEASESHSGALTGWQPIETAPRDGTRILVATQDGKVARGYWHDDLKEFPERHVDADECQREHCGRNHERRLITWSVNGVTAHPPTHWMPLPDPPNCEG